MKKIEELRGLKSDEEKWAWLKRHKGGRFLVMLDNDDTFVVDSKLEDAESVPFDDYVGNAPGVPLILDLLGIKYDRV